MLMFGGILDDGNPMFLLKRPFLADTTVFTFGVTSVADPSVSAQRGIYINFAILECKIEW